MRWSASTLSSEIRLAESLHAATFPDGQRLQHAALFVEASGFARLVSTFVAASCTVLVNLHSQKLKQLTDGSRPYKPAQGSGSILLRNIQM